MNDYSYQDMMRMQNEAKQRVLEMQRRSKSAADSFNGIQKTDIRENESMKEELPRVPKKISYPAEIRSSSVHNKHSGRTAAGKGLDVRAALKNVFGCLSDDDYEKMFIMSLCLLLTKDGADESLIMALMYLLV